MVGVVGVGAVGATSLRCGLRFLGEGDLYLVAEKRRFSDIVRVSSRGVKSGRGLRVQQHGGFMFHFEGVIGRKVFEALTIDQSILVYSVLFRQELLGET